MRNMLQAGYLEDWQRNATLSGAPQGGTVSQFSPIYLHKLDEFVGNTLIPEYTRGETEPGIRNTSDCVTPTGARKSGNHREGAGTTPKAGMPAERGLQRPGLPQTPLRVR